MDLSARGIYKAFDDNVVLRGVDLEIHAGEIIALVGENGAGKSTLTRVISGVYRPDSGALEIDGQPLTFKGPQDAMAHGIQVIYQEFRQNLFPHMSVAENLFVREEGHRYGRVLTSKRKMLGDATALLGRIGLDVDATAAVGDLGVAEQQMVEIAKAIGHELRLLVLDEPTAALDDRESEQLFAQIRRLRESCEVGILYISHRLDEVFALADRIVVVRDGRVALATPTNETTPEDVVAAMVGRAVDDFYPKEANARNRQLALRVDHLTSHGLFADVSFQVRAGEVLGLAGVLGSGRGDVLRALFGLAKIHSGIVSIDGEQAHPRSPAAAIRAGIGYVVPDRGRSGLCRQRSVTENISMAAVRRYTSRLGFVRRGRERAAVADVAQSLQIRAVSTAVPVGTLSGGNQQKALFGKSLLTRPRVLLLEEPTRGVDVGAKAEIYRIINDLTRDGVAVVMVSSDLPELVAMSDRVLVMRTGRVAAELTGDQVSQHNILTHALEVAS